MQHSCEAAGTVAAARGGRAVLTADHLPGHSSVSFPSLSGLAPQSHPLPPPRLLRPSQPLHISPPSPPASAPSLLPHQHPPPPPPVPLTLCPLTQSSPPHLSPSLWLPFCCSLSQILALPGLPPFLVLSNSLSPLVWSDFPAPSLPALSPLCPFSFSSLFLWLCVFSPPLTPFSSASLSLYGCSSPCPRPEPPC